MVVASSPVTAVRSTGGWLCDRVLAGWEAAAVLIDDADSRPLRILGAEPVGLEHALTLARPHRPRTQALAVEVDLYASDERVRRIVRGILSLGTVDVTLFGDWWPTDLGGGRPVPHRLSMAARAFKAQALAAAAAPSGTTGPDTPADPIGEVETFRVSELPRVRSVPDLVSTR